MIVHQISQISITEFKPASKRGPRSRHNPYHTELMTDIFLRLEADKAVAVRLDDHRLAQTLRCGLLVRAKTHGCPIRTAYDGSTLFVALRPEQLALGL